MASEAGNMVSCWPCLQNRKPWLEMGPGMKVNDDACLYPYLAWTVVFIQYMLPGFFNEHLQVVLRIRTTMIRGGGSRKGDLAQVILALHILDCAAQRIFIAIISAIRDYLI